MKPESDGEAYRMQVLEARSNGGEVKNFSEKHASILLEGIFDDSSQSVDILTSRLDPEVYKSKELIDAAMRFLQRGGRLRVVIELDTDWQQIRYHPFIDAMFSHGPIENIGIRSYRNAVIQHQHNFAVGDRQCGRYEPDRLKVEAIGFFHNMERGSMLADQFSQIWSESSDIQGRGPAPSRIRIIHEKSGDTHLFLSPDDLPGLHVGDPNADRGLEALAGIAGSLVSLEIGERVAYRLVRSQGEALDGNHLSLV